MALVAHNERTRIGSETPFVVTLKELKYFISRYIYIYIDRSYSFVCIKIVLTPCLKYVGQMKKPRGWAS